MRVRLFKLGQRVGLFTLGLGTLNLLVLSGASCGKEFSASPGSSVSGSSAAGAGDPSSEAGEGGSVEVGGSGGGGAPTAGSAGRGDGAGSGGKPASGCDCSAGEYCQDGTNRCRKCTDFSRLEFGAAQKLSTLSQSAGGIERFARSAGAGSALFYVSGAADNAKIFYTAAPVSSFGVPVSASLSPESGPLYVAGFADQNLFFDRREAGERKLRMALWTAATLTNEAPVPGLLNAPGFDDYSIAISPNTGHVYWMSTRNGAAQLLWQPTSMSAPPAPAVLELKVKAGTAECPRSGEDATPWVNSAGTLLLFRNPSVDEDCEENDSGATDLFAAPLAQDGTPVAPGVPLTLLNKTGGTSNETDPSLSPDSCVVYFASDNGTGDFDLYRAPRN